MVKNKKEIVAMILAGGQGARLGAITDTIAKPAVPFGGKYRIIDFALSNCSNSNIDTVGILTQYQPLALNTHIGIGSSWDLDTQTGGVKILPPYVDKTGERFFKGTANAIFENIHYVDSYDPEYVLILSGDHIYKMDYQKMLSFHKNKDANLTIAIIEVPWAEANRFGILSANADDEIREFYEKPENPVSNTASMGIYIFKWSVLKEELMRDAENPNSENDFGKDIIPALVTERKRVYGYKYKGYWKDVGTIESLWEANMDLIDPASELNLHDKTWRNYSVNPMSPPQYIAATGSVENSLVNEGCVIEGRVFKSIISTDVTIGHGSSVLHSVIMPNTIIEEDVYIDYAIVISDITVTKGTRIEGKIDKIAVYAGNVGEEGHE